MCVIGGAPSRVFGRGYRVSPTNASCGGEHRSQFSCVWKKLIHWLTTSALPEMLSLWGSWRPHRLRQSCDATAVSMTADGSS